MVFGRVELQDLLVWNVFNISLTVAYIKKIFLSLQSLFTS